MADDKSRPPATDHEINSSSVTQGETMAQPARRDGAGPSDSPKKSDPPPLAEEATPPALAKAPRSPNPTDTDAEGDARSAADPPPLPYRQLGNYRLIRELGRGGMGAVYLAEDLELQRQVALKVMKESVASDSAARARFIREARTAAKVENDHIIRVYQVGEDQGVPFLAMELLKGQTLEEWMKNRPISVEQIVRFGIQIALGLSAAHDAGLIHRDIKPSNLWTESPHGRIKILDFGLARLEKDTGEVTSSGAVVGTPAYMSPEQATGIHVDHRTDLFSLGAVLYHLSTGQRPFAGPTAMAILTNLATVTPAAPHLLNPQIPAVVSALIMQLLQKRPENRPESAREVINRLTAISGSASLPEVEINVEQPSVRPAVPGRSAQGAPVTPSPWTEIDATEPIDSPNERPGPMAGRRKWAMAVTGGLAACALIAVTLYLTVIRVSNGKGTLVIECDDPSVEVKIVQGKTVVVDRTSRREVELTVGDYGIELVEPKEGLKLSTRSFSMSRGGREVVRVRLEPPKTEIAKNPGKSDSESPTTTGVDSKTTAGPVDWSTLDWRMIRGATRAEFRIWCDRLPRGFYPVHVTARSGTPEILIDSIARRLPGVIGMTISDNAQSEFQEQFNKLRDSGYVLKNRTLYGERGGIREVAVWLRCDPATPTAWAEGTDSSGLWETWTGTDLFITDRVSNANRLGNMPGYFSAVEFPDPATKDGARGFISHDCILLHANPTKVAWRIRTHVAHEKTTELIAEYAANGYRPRTLGTHHNPVSARLSVIFIDERRGPEWTMDRDLKEADFTAKSADRIRRGFRLASMVSTHGPTGPLYSAVWEKSAAIRMPRFESLESADVERAVRRDPHSAARGIVGSPGKNNQLTPGTIVAVTTKEGNFGKLLIVENEESLVFDWVVYAPDGRLIREGSRYRLNPTQTFDLENGSNMQSAMADLHWNRLTPAEFQLIHMDSARAVVVDRIDNFRPARTRNPFGLGDVADPLGVDVMKFADRTKPKDSPADENAKPWSKLAHTSPPGSIDGVWESRWKAGNGLWQTGKADVRTVGDRVFISYRDMGNYLIELRREPGNRLVGRYLNLSLRYDGTPWVGLVVGTDRIDGYWTGGRWDLRRMESDTEQSVVVLRTPHHRVDGHRSEITSLAIHPKGDRFVTVGSDGSTRISSTENASAIEPTTLTPTDFRSAQYDAEGATLLLGGADGTLRFRDAVSGAATAVPHRIGQPIKKVAYFPIGNRCIVVTADNTVMLVDPGSSGTKPTWKPGASVDTFAVSPDGRQIVTAATDQSVCQVRNLVDGTEKFKLSGHTTGVLCTTFSPDGTRIVTGGTDRTIRIWSAVDGKPLGVIRGHEGPVTDIAFSPDGSRIVSASGDKTARIWEPATGFEICRLQAHGQAVTFAQYVPNGRRVVTTGRDGSILIWQLPESAQTPKQGESAPSAAIPMPKEPPK